ncbi:mgsA AAA+ ATPase family protein [Mycobacterium xenopi 4042]|uniref:MgsA AAA+ ATPase family protein n=1 Tax=Mycobacterium xenopi 4042 TaxID=1299334 RepID=X7ZI82_MYCXE|nr:mgsA AAA+ ATPase family protein [Mycobacterium xenopi 4042]
MIEMARKAAAHGEQTVLFIDEVHRFSKTQQDALLSAVENRVVLLVAATTENPSFSVVAPLLSRSLILQLRPLTADDVRTVVQRAIDDPRGLAGRVPVDPDAVELLVRLAAGDARRALTALEVAAEAANPVTVEAIERSLDKAAVRYDRDGDQHYDVISAFIKSVRGSDVDAALHYLARMLVAGEDPRFIARRLMILASEDIGMADPTALQTAVAAAHTVQLIGMPEAQLTLAHATVHLATAPKSNAVTTALGAAMADIHAGKAGLVPAHLRDGHYSGAAALGNAVGYKYSHDHPDGVVAQQYPPDELVGVDYYHPTGHGGNAKSAAVCSGCGRSSAGKGRTVMKTFTDDEMNELLSAPKPYSVVILKRGPDFGSANTPAIIWEHGRRNFALRHEGVLAVVLPITDGSEVCGSACPPGPSTTPSPS